MAILSAEQIRDRLFNRNKDRRLIITPLLDFENQIQNKNCSLDIRLGTEFIVTRRTKYATLNVFASFTDAPSERDPETFGLRFGQGTATIERDIERFQEKSYVNFGQEIVIHPNQLLLGSTLEYFRFPMDLAAYVIGRSSWGRLGLIIATATVVHPGFTGVLTLEIVNVGETPITLCPGIRIGQLVFHEVEQDIQSIRFKDVYNAKYVATTGPGFSMIYKDRDIETLKTCGRLLSSKKP